MEQTDGQSDFLSSWSELKNDYQINHTITMYNVGQCRDHTGIKIQLLMLYYAKLNGQIKIKVCGLVYAKT